MAERRVSVDGETYLLERPFLVIATQNPVDQEGTFPLPEAQLDRFLIRLSLGYTPVGTRIRHVWPDALGSSDRQPGACGFCRRNRRLPECLPRSESRSESSQLHPRSCLRNARARRRFCWKQSASIDCSSFSSGPRRQFEGNAFVLPDDVKRVAPAVLAHRIIVRPESRLRRVTAGGIIEEILNESSIPTIKEGVDIL